MARAPSAVPWAWPILPEMRPIAWLVVPEMDERRVEPSATAPETEVASEVASSREVKRTPVASARLPLALEEMRSSSSRVASASAMVSRAAETVPWASVMLDERSSTVPLTPRTRLTMLVAALSVSPFAETATSWSLPTTTLVTVETKVSFICVSTVEAPVSVTLGAMGLTFSFT